jgi:hypothetical protein
MTKKDWKRVSVCMSDHEFRQLRIAAAECNVSMSEVIRTLLVAYYVELEIKRVKTDTPS